MRANTEVRQALKKNNVYEYQLAYALGYSSGHFNKMLRLELSQEMKEHCLKIIDDLKNGVATNE